MSDTDQHSALTFVMSARHLSGIIKKHLPNQETIIRLDGLAQTGFGATEVAAGAGLLADPDPIFSKIGGAVLVAHGMDAIAAGDRAWRTGRATPTMTERAALAAAHMAHASPVMADVVGATADMLVPAGLLHAIGHLAERRALRVVSADASHLAFDHGDITPEHFLRPAPRQGPPANQNLILPHRQNHFDANRHEGPDHNHRVGSHVLRKHVDLTAEVIERRFTEEKQRIVSFFTSKEEAERTIHQVLKDNGHLIDNWLKTSGKDERLVVRSPISGQGTVVIDRADQVRREARRVEVTIKNTEYNGMAYHVLTVRLYAR